MCACRSCGWSAVRSNGHNCARVFLPVLCPPRLGCADRSILVKYMSISTSLKTPGLPGFMICKAKIKFRVIFHFRSSGSWFAGPTQKTWVPERAARLPRRVCLDDLHIVHGAVLGVCFHHAYSIHHSYTLAHTAKNGVFAIKPLGRS